MYTYCPRDHFAITSKDLNGADVLQCAHCHGVWIPKASLLLFNKEKQSPFLEDYLEQEGLPEHFKQGALLCPSDGSKMLFTTLNDIEVDICPTCHGVWLDKGEMESLPDAQPSQPQSSHSAGYNALDILVHLPAPDGGAELFQAGADTVGAVANSVGEIAAEAASGAGDVLGDLLGAIAEALFGG